MSRSLIIDTESNISIPQTSVTRLDVRVTKKKQYGVTCETSMSMGLQVVNFWLNRREYTQKYLVYFLRTEAAGPLVIDFQ
jgi:hypothetical protein